MFVPKRGSSRINSATIHEAGQGARESEVNSLSFHNKGIVELENLEKCVKLTSLDVSFNYVEEVKNIQTLERLQYLQLHFNQIKKIQGLLSLKKLLIVTLHDNSLKKIEGLESAKGLQSLRLDINQISKIEGLQNQVNMTSLNLSSNKIKKIENLDSMSKLEELFLNENYIEKIENLRFCQRTLNELQLSGNLLTSGSCGLKEGYRDFKLLTIIRVNNNRISDLQTFGRIKSLKELHINDNLISRCGCARNLFPDLDVLDIGNNKLNARDDVLSLCKLTMLEDLNLEGNPICDMLKDGEVAATIKSLEVLDGTSIDRPEKREKEEAKAKAEAEGMDDKTEVMTEFTENPEMDNLLADVEEEMRQFKLKMGIPLEVGDEQKKKEVPKKRVELKEPDPAAFPTPRSSRPQSAASQKDQAVLPLSTKYGGPVKIMTLEDVHKDAAHVDSQHDHISLKFTKLRSSLSNAQPPSVSASQEGSFIAGDGDNSQARPISRGDRGGGAARNLLRAKSFAKRFEEAPGKELPIPADGRPVTPLKQQQSHNVEPEPEPEKIMILKGGQRPPSARPGSRNGGVRSECGEDVRGGDRARVGADENATILPPRKQKLAAARAPPSKDERKGFRSFKLPARRKPVEE